MCSPKNKERDYWHINDPWASSVSHLFLSVYTSRFLLCQHHFSLGRDLYTLTQGLLQLLDAVVFLLQRILGGKPFNNMLLTFNKMLSSITDKLFTDTEFFL